MYSKKLKTRRVLMAEKIKLILKVCNQKKTPGKPGGYFSNLVPEAGLEPVCRKAHAPKACVSTNSTTRA